MQLPPHVLRYREVIRHVKTSAVVSCIAIAASDCATYYYIHVLNKGFDTDSHNMIDLLYYLLPQSSVKQIERMMP